ncbi:putative glutathione-specific gamma-glutamylcyclotransferase 2 isoform X8 [Portunus trituberculatus]|uniref:putative glutathione-specific gamma-glutamylcyclotransferase 2 isoform X8 n=1 Tax=Portunus trituberculatus TaxID=210409 RepID=UPI001E1CF0DC|nr:putative glutathione-specific gamma-glutamylcyclotransferase 2 isoform X8 [Portunus trituberculatus]
MWLFGYGSLTWKVDFPYKQRVVGYIKGYSRRFWQASVDHRGVPGRAQVWGAAYEILPQQEAEVTKKLNIREQRFDTRLEMTMYDAEDQKLPHPVMVFVGTSQKELFLGDAPLETLAKQISECHGPSGPNYEYLFQLAKFMRMEVPEAKDEHLFQLEKAVKNILLNINVKFVSSS